MQFDIMHLRTISFWIRVLDYCYHLIVLVNPFIAEAEPFSGRIIVYQLPLGHCLRVLIALSATDVILPRPAPILLPRATARVQALPSDVVV